MSNEMVLKTLKQSMYRDASNDSIEMVLAYCVANKIDPMMTPWHITTRKSKKKDANGNFIKDGKYFAMESVEVLMPSIDLYRIRAHRSGNYAGIKAVAFGPLITEKLKSGYDSFVDVTYPEWCEITVKKIVQGVICEFIAKEYFMEYYQASNKRWADAPRAQFEKCVEMMALRKGWGEIEELRFTNCKVEINVEEPLLNAQERAMNQIAELLPRISDEGSDTNIPMISVAPEKITEKTLNSLELFVEMYGITPDKVQGWLDHYYAKELKDLTEQQGLTILKKGMEKINLESNKEKSV